MQGVDPERLKSVLALFAPRSQTARTMDKKTQANQAKGREKGHAKPTALSATAKSEKMAVAAPLTGAEKQRLVALEKVIDAKLGDFFEVGIALMEVKSQELFRETHRNFHVYCQER